MHPLYYTFLDLHLFSNTVLEPIHAQLIMLKKLRHRLAVAVRTSTVFLLEKSLRARFFLKSSIVPTNSVSKSLHPLTVAALFSHISVPTFRHLIVPVWCSRVAVPTHNCFTVGFWFSHIPVPNYCSFLVFSCTCHVIFLILIALLGGSAQVIPFCRSSLSVGSSGR